MMNTLTHMTHMADFIRCSESESHEYEPTADDKAEYLPETRPGN